MWTNENRSRYDRSKLRYPSDLTDEEWTLIAPVIPGAKRGGGKRTVDLREVVNGLMYVLSTGCQWRALPKDLPPRSTVNGYFSLWDYDGTLDRIHHSLYVQCREQAGRDASPTAAIVDSQSVKSAEKGGGGLIPTASTRAEVSKVPAVIAVGKTPEIPCCGSSGSRGVRGRVESFLGADHRVGVDQQLACDGNQDDLGWLPSAAIPHAARAEPLAAPPEADMRATKAASGLLFRLALRAHM